MKTHLVALSLAFLLTLSSVSVLALSKGNPSTARQVVPLSVPAVKEAPLTVVNLAPVNVTATAHDRQLAESAL